MQKNAETNLRDNAGSRRLLRHGKGEYAAYAGSAGGAALTAYSLVTGLEGTAEKTIGAFGGSGTGSIEFLKQGITIQMQQPNTSTEILNVTANGKLIATFNEPISNMVSETFSYHGAIYTLNPLGTETSTHMSFTLQEKVLPPLLSHYPIGPTITLVAGIAIFAVSMVGLILVKRRRHGSDNADTD